MTPRGVGRSGRYRAMSIGQYPNSVMTDAGRLGGLEAAYTAPSTFRLSGR